MNNNLSNIKKSRYFLNKRECIAIPTETVYGLAANAYSDRATSKIFKLSLPLNLLTTCSTIISVSGLGIKTFWLTSNFLMLSLRTVTRTNRCNWKS